MKDRGKLIGYIADECTVCGRIRVETWENGDQVCEKCGWNQKEKCYERDYDI